MSFSAIWTRSHAHDYYTDHLWRYDPHTAAKPGFDGQMGFPENQGGKKGIYMWTCSPPPR